MSGKTAVTSTSLKDTKCDPYLCQDKDCKKDHTHEHIINKKIVICKEYGCTPCTWCNGYNFSGSAWCINCENKYDDFIDCKHGYSYCNGNSCSKCYD